MSKSDIVISGIAGRWPKSDNLDKLWDNLRQAIPLYQKDDNPYTKLFPQVTKSRGALNNPRLFDCSFFGYSESDAAELDPQFRILHETVYESLWDAGICPENWRSTRTGFFVGSFIDDVDTVVNWEKRADFLQLSSNRIPFVFNFTGPSVRLDSACASSLTAFHEAVSAIRTGQCDQAIVAGLSIHQRLGTVVEGSEIDIFSKSGKSKCLDVDADGYIRCEAIVSLVLQKSSQAKRMYATIRGSAINADGYTLTGITSPRPETQRDVMIDAMNLAAVDPLEVDYIEAHLTSTQAGDVAECSSTLAAYRPNSDKPLLLGCLKSNLGHSEAASGLVGIAKVIKIFQTQMIPPNIGLVTPNPKIDGLLDGRLIPVINATPFKGKYIGVNSFGFGGANAHVLLSCDAPDYQPSNSNKQIDYRLIYICNRTIDGIDKTINWIQTEPKAIRDDCLSLLDDISLTPVSTGISARGYVLINNHGSIIKQNKSLISSNHEPINLTIKLDPSLTNYTKVLSKLKPFNDSITSFYQDHSNLNDLTIDVASIVTFIGMVDLLTSLGLSFKLIIDNPLHLSIVSDYKFGGLSRSEAIDQVRLIKKTQQLNGESKTNGPPSVTKKPSTISSSSTQLTLILSTNLILASDDGKLLQSTDSPIDWLETFHSTLGLLYLQGLTIRLSSLYPTYDYPVARDCPSLSGLISWSHTNEYPVLERYAHYFDLPKRTVHRVDLLDPEYFSVADHIIDDRVIFPATGYIYLVRKHLALIHFGPFTDIFTFSFKVWKVNILRAAFITEPIEFTVNYDHNSQFFEIQSSGAIYATGYGAIVKPKSTPISTTTIASTSPSQEVAHDYGYIKPVDSEEMDLNQDEFYQELAISGYRYRSAYQNVISAKIIRSSAVLNYTKNWMALADSFLQLEAFWSNERKLLVPTAIGEMRFDVNVFKSMLATGQDMIKVYSTKPGLIGADGMIFEGIETKEFPVKGQQDRLRVGRQLFYPLTNNYVQLDEKLSKIRSKYCQLGLSSLKDAKKIDKSEILSLFDELNVATHEFSPNLLNLLNESIMSSDRIAHILSRLSMKGSEKLSDDLISLIPVDCVHPLVDLVAENHRRELKISIQNYDFTSKMLKKLIQPQFNAICKGCVFIDETTSKPSNRKLTSDQAKSGSEMILTVYKHHSVDLFGGSTINHDESYIVSTLRGNFCLIVVREKLTHLEERIIDYCQLPVDCDLASATHKLFKLMDNESNYIQIGSTFCQEIGLRCILYRRRPILSAIDSHRVIKINGPSDYLWFNEIKRTLDQIDQTQRIWLVADESSQNGILGLANCLSLEPAFSNKIRCLFMPEQPFNQPTDLTNELIDRDLLINVCVDGVWGFYRIDEMSLEFQQQLTLSPYVCLEIAAKSDGRVQWVQNDPLIREIAADPSIVNDLIRVAYSSLNFRDTLLAGGLMPPNAYPNKVWYRLGLEFSGYHKGQRIMGVCGGNGFSTFLSPKHPHLVTMKVPDHWNMAQAATIPVCYMTVIYGLIIRGNLQPGETVLIHAGSGGVGLAAISVCLSLGCKIFTTVSTRAKQHAVQRIFPQLPDESFTDSRSIKFEEFIMKRTNGRGVDIVLNSLIHDKFDAGLRILAENGRFLDLSKVDIFEDKAFDRMDLQPNISIHAICLATLVAAERFDEINKIVQIIEDGVANGMVIPLPYTVYDHSEVAASFNKVSAAKHSGKVLIQFSERSSQEEGTTPLVNSSIYPSSSESLLISCVKKTGFDPTKSYLIIGGLGGMGLELIFWMVERGARKIVITSRSGIKTNYQRFAIRRIRSISSSKVEISRLDAANGKSALRLIREASRLGPIGGIFNLAVVLKDGLFPNQTLDNFRYVFWPKIEATRNMDILSRQHCPFIDYFVCFSSVASLGNLGQSNYGYANSYMERVCETRRKNGLPGLAIQWGPVGDVGIAVRTIGDKSSIAGFEPQRIRSCLEVLNVFLQADVSVGFSAIPIIDKDENDPQDALVRVSRIIGVKDIRVINLKLRLRDLGMDSVQAIEVQEYLEHNFNFSLGAVSIYDLSLENLIKIASVEVKSIDMDIAGLDKIFRPLKKTGQRPVFFFPPAIFDFLGMVPLARGLDRQVFGIDFTDDNEIAKDWQTLTDFYCSRILEQWPNEPTYDFLSYSLGAAFAYEVARKIKILRGENSVRKMVFIDSTPNGIQQALMWSVRISETVGNLNIDKESLLAFLKRMDRKQGNSWRARTFKTTQKASNLDLTQDLLFKKYQYIAQMKIEPKLKVDALFFKCKHTISAFEGSIAVSLDKSIDGNIETILVDSNHAEIITQCKDLLISECNKFLAL